MLSVLFFGATSVAAAENILDRTISELSGNGDQIYTGLCAKLAGSCGLFIDTSLVPIVHRSTFSNSVVRDILQEIVPPEGPYAWRENNGVINIVPKYVIDGELTAMTRRVSGRFENKLSVVAAQKLLEQTGLPWGTTVVSGRYKTVKMKLVDVPIMDALNQVVKADGSAYWLIGRSQNAAMKYQFELVSMRRVGGKLFPVFKN